MLWAENIFYLYPDSYIIHHRTSKSKKWRFLPYLFCWRVPSFRHSWNLKEKWTELNLRGDYYLYFDFSSWLLMSSFFDVRTDSILLTSIICLVNVLTTYRTSKSTIVVVVRKEIFKPPVIWYTHDVHMISCVKTIR